MELRQVAILVNADHRLQERAMRGDLVHPVRKRRGQTAELADEVGVPEHPVLHAHPALGARFRRARTQHQAWKIHGPAMRRRVGAVVVAELALVTEIDDFLDVGRRQLLHVAVDRVDVDSIEHHLEGRTERQASPTSVADVVDAPELAVDVAAVPELGRPYVEGIHVIRRCTRSGRRRQ